MRTSSSCAARSTDVSPCIASTGVSVGCYGGDPRRAARGDLPGGPPPAPTLPTAASGPVTPPQAPPAPADPGQVSLRTLRIIQFREGRDSEPLQLDIADKATVLRLLRADLAWLERVGSDDDGGGA